ncbi:MAG: 60S ribosomal export protein NMD3 [Methanomicrobiales archaeon]|nr:60S ribosomal export protein NMD3 [Methanomicrobiales archaeon]
MQIKESFCPRCGRPSVGPCPVCASGEAPAISFQQRAECIRCPVCGMIRKQGGWRWAEEKETIAERLAESAVVFHPMVEDREISISCQERSSNRTLCEIHARGMLRGAPVEASGEVEIVWRKELCTRCSRRSGGYYEGVVQVRASRRACTPYEHAVALGIAESAESSLQESGDTLSFILRTEEVHGALDIVVGTQSLGRLIASRIVDRLGGTYRSHPKLVGEKNGIPIYRVTYVIRLPFYQKGDVIEAEGHYSEIRESGAKNVTLFDLETGRTRVSPQEETWRLVGNVREAQHALIAFRERDIVGIIEPATGITREIRAVNWLEEQPGEAIRVIVDLERETLVVVG